MIPIPLAVGAALLLAATPRPTEPPPEVIVETTVMSEMARLGIPGLTVAVVINGELKWTTGYGIADLENAVPARPETVYRLASISKPITAAAVLQLAEQGKLDLDAPIRKYVPAFPEKKWPVSLRQLLAHQGGIRHVMQDEWHSTRHYASVADGLEIFKDDDLLFEPGTRAEYSTYGFNLLGLAVEAASGLSFVEYLKQNVFDPAGMEHTRADDPYEIIPFRAPGYLRNGSGEIVNSVLADTSNKIPGGGLVSTAGDVARFALALQSETLLKRGTLRRMFAAQKTLDGRTTGYGLGWRVGTWKGHREVWHHGGQPRVSTLLYMQPDRKLAIVFLANLENVWPQLTDLARQLSLRIAR
jgi:serine beta-lactamase-like protein LACTB